MDQANAKDGNANLLGSTRKAYVAPHLTLFGQVAALTQNVSCSANSDSNVSCVPGATGTMGMAVI